MKIDIGLLTLLPSLKIQFSKTSGFLVDIKTAQTLQLYTLERSQYSVENDLIPKPRNFTKMAVF